MEEPIEEGNEEAEEGIDDVDLELTIHGATVNLPPGFQRITRSGGIRQQELTNEEPDTGSDDSGGENNEEPDTELDDSGGGKDADMEQGE